MFFAAVEMLYYQAVIVIEASFLIPVPLSNYVTVEQCKMVILFLKNVWHKAILKHNLVLASLPSPLNQLSSMIKIDLL